VTPNTLSRSGFTFNGWNTQFNGSGTAYANGATYPFTAGLTLYAQWTPRPSPHAIRLIGTITSGQTQNVTIVGTNFTSTSKVASNERGTTVRVLNVTSTRVAVHVVVKKGVRPGPHSFKLTLRDGASCTLRYVSK
jgi:uncharacterized repeat protein (TIGR02543 family)